MALPPEEGGLQPRVMIALSGGLDSTVLLHAAVLLLGPAALVAVHVNHRLQPAAAAFERHVRAQCKAWGTALRVRRLGESPPKGASIEAWAREQRYRIFEQEAARQGIADLFTAHHRDDQLETLFIALSRGAGLQGLAGIAPQRQLGGLQVHRPLLDCSRAQLLDHARAHGLQWIEDPSNQEARFLRNRLRHQVLPALEQALPGFGQQALASQRHLADAALAERAGRRAPQSVATSGGSQGQERLLLRTWLQAQGLRPPPARQLQDWLQQLQARTGALRLEGPGWALRTQGQQVWVEQGGAAGPLLATPAGWRWPLPAFGGQLLIQPRGAPPAGGFAAPADLQARPPRSSDKLLAAPGRPRRSLKNLFQEHGIEAALRPRLPCIWQGDWLLHVPGLGTDPASPWTFHFLPDL